jgi:hypothetical protein
VDAARRAGRRVLRRQRREQFTAGFLVDRFGARPVLLSGMALLAAARCSPRWRRARTGCFRSPR